MRSQLKKIEDLGAAMEEALILDNKYTEHSTVVPSHGRHCRGQNALRC